MKLLFIIVSSVHATSLTEMVYPYRHLSELGGEITFASLEGGQASLNTLPNPDCQGFWEAEKLVSEEFLLNADLLARLDATVRLRDVRPQDYDAVHVTGGVVAAFDLSRNDDIANILEYFWSAGKILGVICNGATTSSTTLSGRKCTMTTSSSNGAHAAREHTDTRLTLAS